MSNVTKKAQDEVNRIASSNKDRITPEMILSPASKKTNPMHDYFEWDNSSAGHQYRVIQARRLIRSIKVTIVSRHVEVTAVAYVRDPACGNDEQGYVSVSKVRTEDDNARDVMLDEFTRVSSALKRARELATVFNMVDDVDHFIEKIELMKVQVTDHASA